MFGRKRKAKFEQAHNVGHWTIEGKLLPPSPPLHRRILEATRIAAGLAMVATTAATVGLGVIITEAVKFTATATAKVLLNQIQLKGV